MMEGNVMSLTTIISLIASIITIFEFCKKYHEKVVRSIVSEVVNELKTS